MTTEASAGRNARVLIVGRSPSVLLAAADLLRGRGYAADATNRFDRILDDYDVAGLDVLVFGGMVPPDTKQTLREEIARRNAGITFLQGLAGIPGVIAAQVQAETYGEGPEIGEVTYDEARRTLQIVLAEPEHVSVEALWGTSFTPPEPKSTSTQLFSGEMAAGTHVIGIPAEVPEVASFVAVGVGRHMRVLTLGGLPESVRRMAPRSDGDRRLPAVDAVATHL